MNMTNTTTMMDVEEVVSDNMENDKDGSNKRLFDEEHVSKDEERKRMKMNTADSTQSQY